MHNPDDAPMDDFEIADPLEDDEISPEGWEEEGAAEPEAGEDPFTSAS